MTTMPDVEQDIPHDFSLEDALARLHDRAVKALKLLKRIEEATAALPTCFACHIERANAKQAGASADQLPPLRPVAAILPMTAVVTPEGNLMINGGGGVCAEHLQIGQAPAPPAMPGRTASGLYLGAPGMGV